MADEKISDARSLAEMYLDLMGHDIKNRMMIAAGNIEMATMALEQAGNVDPAIKACLVSSLRSLENTAVLIDNVQKLQRTSSEELTLQKMDVCEVLENVIGELQASMERDMSIRFRRCPACMVYANELLKDIFVNLIGNAIKHYSLESQLFIDVAMDVIEDGGKNYCMVAVVDNGPGIPDEVKDRLFRRFSRGIRRPAAAALACTLSGPW